MKLYIVSNINGLVGVYTTRDDAKCVARRDTLYSEIDDKAREIIRLQNLLTALYNACDGKARGRSHHRIRSGGGIRDGNSAPGNRGCGMTAHELHECDPEFRAMIAAWVATRACPVGLGDFLEERGCSALMCRIARWCAAQPERKTYTPLTELGEDPTPCGVFPTINNDGTWFFSSCVTSVYTADDIPTSICLLADKNKDGDTMLPPKYKSPTECILHLLDAREPKEIP